MNIPIKNFLSGNQRSVIIKKNIIGSFLIKGVSITISLILVPITLGYVSSELYGIWLTLSSIMVWLNFFDIGFTLGLKNKLAEAIALSEWEKGRSLVSTTYFIMTIIFIPLCVILICGISLINWAEFLNVNPIYNQDISQTLYILIICFCIQMIVNVLTAVISAYQKVALSAAFPVIGNFLSLIIITILIKLYPPSLAALALAISIPPIIVLFIASIILFHKQFKAVSPRFKYINKEYIRHLFSLGVKFFIIQIQVIIMYQCTNILISNVSGPNEVTSYNIAYKYLGIAMMIYSIILSPLWPAFTDAYTKKDFNWMTLVYKKMIIIYIISVIILLLMLLISPFIYQIWIGTNANIPFIMSLSVTIYMIISTWNSLQVQLINGIGSIKLQTYITFIGLTLHIPLSLLLGNKMGAIGVICSMCIINIIYATVFSIQIHKILHKKASGIWIQ